MAASPKKGVSHTPATGIIRRRAPHARQHIICSRTCFNPQARVAPRPLAARRAARGARRATVPDRSSDSARYRTEGPDCFQPETTFRTSDNVGACNETGLDSKNKTLRRKSENKILRGPTCRRPLNGQVATAERPAVSRFFPWSSSFPSYSNPASSSCRCFCRRRPPSYRLCCGSRSYRSRIP
jgi:hypothetical protein